MAIKTDCLSRRKLLNESQDGARLREMAAALLDKDMLADAATFMIKAEDVEGLETLAERAVGEGDLFLLGRVTKALQREPTVEELTQLAGNAEKTGKVAFAQAIARRLAGPENKG